MIEKDPMDDIKTVPTPVTETRDTRDRIAAIWNDIVARGAATLQGLLATCELYVALREALEIVSQVPPPLTWANDKDPCMRYQAMHHRTRVDLREQILKLEGRHPWIVEGGLKADWDAALERAQEARAVGTSWRFS